MFNDYKMLGRPMNRTFHTGLKPSDLSYRHEYVNGTPYVNRETYYDVRERCEYEYTEVWNSPDLEWMAEFTADADSVEKLKDGWAVQRDGYEYIVPMKWGVRRQRQPKGF